MSFEAEEQPLVPVGAGEDPATRRVLDSALLGATESLAKQFIRYVIVGGLAFLVDFSVLYVLTEGAGLHYLTSAAFAFGCGLVTNYLLSRYWVFSRRTLNNVLLEFVLFAVIGLLGLGLNELIIWFVHEEIHLHYMIGKVISAGIVLVWNFGARKLLLFR